MVFQNAEETINKLNNLFDLRSENDLDLHINEVKKKSNILTLDGQEYTYYNLSDKNKYDFIETLKRNNYDDLPDMVYILELTYSEIIHRLGVKYFPTSTTGYILPPGVNEIRNCDFLLQSFLPNNVEVKLSTDDIRLRSNLSTNRTMKFTEKSFFYTMLGFSQGELRDIERFFKSYQDHIKVMTQIKL